VYRIFVEAGAAAIDVKGVSDRHVIEAPVTRVVVRKGMVAPDVIPAACPPPKPHFEYSRVIASVNDGKQVVRLADHINKSIGPAKTSENRRRFTSAR
jgi:hypothetical protein